MARDGLGAVEGSKGGVRSAAVTDVHSSPARAHGPAIILVEPQLGENIGAAARAMYNCGLEDLRIVSPRDGWPSPSARSAATGAARIVDEAQVCDRLADATADLHEVFATTARRRDMNVRVCDLESGAERWHALEARGQRAGILFGPERTGLHNDDISRSHVALTIPLNPAFTSLNLGQAVLLVSYAWFRLSTMRKDGMAEHQPAARAQSEAEGWIPAPAGELENLFEHLKQSLDRAGYLRVPEKRPAMMRNLRNLLSRAHMTADEVRTFHGVVSALSGFRKDGRPVRATGSKTRDDAP